MNIFEKRRQLREKADLIDDTNDIEEPSEDEEDPYEDDSQSGIDHMLNKHEDLSPEETVKQHQKIIDDEHSYRNDHETSHELMNNADTEGMYNFQKDQLKNLAAFHKGEKDDLHHQYDDWHNSVNHHQSLIDDPKFDSLSESKKTKKNKLESIPDALKHFYSHYPEELKSSADSILKHYGSDSLNESSIYLREKDEDENTAPVEDEDEDEGLRREYMTEGNHRTLWPDVYEHQTAIQVHNKSAAAKKAKGLDPHGPKALEAHDKTKKAQAERLKVIRQKAEHPGSKPYLKQRKQTAEQYIAEQTKKAKEQGNHSAATFMNSLYHNHGKEPHEIDEVHHTAKASDVRDLLTSKGINDAHTISQNDNPADIAVGFNDNTLRGASLKKGGGALGASSLSNIDATLGSSSYNMMSGKKQTHLDEYNKNNPENQLTKNDAGGTRSHTAISGSWKKAWKDSYDPNNSEMHAKFKSEQEDLRNKMSTHHDEFFHQADLETRRKHINTFLKQNNHRALPYDLVSSDLDPNQQKEGKSLIGKDHGKLTDDEFENFTPSDKTKDDDISSPWESHRSSELLRNATDLRVHRTDNKRAHFVDQDGNIISAVDTDYTKNADPFSTARVYASLEKKGKNNISDLEKEDLDHKHIAPTVHQYHDADESGLGKPGYKESLNVPLSSSREYAENRDNLPKSKDIRSSHVHTPDYQKLDKLKQDNPEDPRIEKLHKNDGDSHYFMTMHDKYISHHKKEIESLKEDKDGTMAIKHHLVTNHGMSEEDIANNGVMDKLDKIKNGTSTANPNQAKKIKKLTDKLDSKRNDLIGRHEKSIDVHTERHPLLGNNVRTSKNAHKELHHAAHNGEHVRMNAKTNDEYNSHVSQIAEALAAKDEPSSKAAAPKKRAKETDEEKRARNHANIAASRQRRADAEAEKPKPPITDEEHKKHIKDRSALKQDGITVAKQELAKKMNLNLNNKDHARTVNKHAEGWMQTPEGSKAIKKYDSNRKLKIQNHDAAIATRTHDPDTNARLEKTHGENSEALHNSLTNHVISSLKSKKTVTEGLNVFEKRRLLRKNDWFTSIM